MEKPIKAISPQGLKIPTLNIEQVCRKAGMWLWWGGVPSIVLFSGVVLYDTFRVESVEAKRPIELMSKVSVIALPMSADDKKAAEIVYLPMPRWQLEALPRRIAPNYANKNRSSNVITEPSVMPAKTKPKQIKPPVNTAPAPISSPMIEVADRSPEKVSPSTEIPWNIDQLDFTGMSDELIAQLKMAIADTQNGSLDEESLAKQMVKEAQSQVPQSKAGDLDNIVSLYALPEAIKQSLPKIDLQTHLYSSVAEKRLIRVNGLDVAEGEIMAEGVMLEKIEPRQVIFWFDGRRIAMPALSEW